MEPTGPIAAVNSIVMNDIRAQSSYGARFPSPVRCEANGGGYTPTADAIAKAVGCKDWQAKDHALLAVRRLQRAGKLIFVSRFGYTWVMRPTDYYKRDGDEVVDHPINPCNVPLCWRDDGARHAN